MMMCPWETHNLPFPVFLPSHKYKHEPSCKYQEKHPAFSLPFTLFSLLDQEGFVLMPRLGQKTKNAWYTLFRSFFSLSM